VNGNNTKQQQNMMKQNKVIQYTASITLILTLAIASVAFLTGFHAPAPVVEQSRIDDSFLPDSVESLRALVEKEPQNIDARQKLALRLYQSGERAQAIEQSRLASREISLKADRVIEELSRESDLK
jgi:hypothetical protein